MTPARERLADLLAPVRDVHVAALLERLAAELDAGGEVDVEPMDRDASGRVRRHAPLDLPMRHDLRVARRGRTLDLTAPDQGRIDFAPVRGRVPGGAALRILPFRWGAAEVLARRPAGRPNWGPFRLWFLEWFQPRFGEESPDLLCATHGVRGPLETEAGWRLTVDLGSASVAAFPAMLEALGRSGCPELRIGDR